MSTDLSYIRKCLQGCEEIKLPYKFPKNCWVKYITINGEDEAFYEGGIFHKMGNQKVILKNGSSRYTVPTLIKSDEGEILYKSRFFIDPRKLSDCEIKRDQLSKTIKAQQNVIEKMSEQIKILEEKNATAQSIEYDLMSTIQENEDIIRELTEKEKKYKLVLSQYIH